MIIPIIDPVNVNVKPFQFEEQAGRVGFDNQIYIAATASNMRSWPIIITGTGYTLFMAKSLELFLNELAHFTKTVTGDCVV